MIAVDARNPTDEFSTVVLFLNRTLMSSLYSVRTRFVEGEVGQQAGDKPQLH